MSDSPFDQSVALWFAAALQAALGAYLFSDGQALGIVAFVSAIVTGRQAPASIRTLVSEYRDGVKTTDARKRESTETGELRKTIDSLSEACKAMRRTQDFIPSRVPQEDYFKFCRSREHADALHDMLRKRLSELGAEHHVGNVMLRAR